MCERRGGRAGFGTRDRREHSGCQFPAPGVGSIIDMQTGSTAHPSAARLSGSPSHPERRRHTRQLDEPSAGSPADRSCRTSPSTPLLIASTTERNGRGKHPALGLPGIFQKIQSARERRRWNRKPFGQLQCHMGKAAGPSTFPHVATSENPSVPVQPAGLGRCDGAYQSDPGRAPRIPRNPACVQEVPGRVPGLVGLGRVEPIFSTVPLRTKFTMPPGSSAPHNRRLRGELLARADSCGSTAKQEEGESVNAIALGHDSCATATASSSDFSDETLMQPGSARLRWDVVVQQDARVFMVWNVQPLT